MNLFLFRSEICLKSMWKNVKLNFVVIVSLCVGMMIPLVALADIQYFFEYSHTACPAVMDSAAYFYSAAPQADTAQIYEVLSKDPLFRRTAVMESARREVECEGEEYYETVSAASREVFTFYPPCMVSGRCLEEEDFTGETKVCLVEENFFQDNRLRGEPGGKLVIDGTEYTIAGICRKIDSRGRIWIPWSRASSLQGGSEIRVLVQYEPETDFAEAEAMVRPLLGNVVSAGTLEQDYRVGRKQGVKLCLSILFLIFPLILFSLINCFAVIQGKLRRMRYQFAVEMAYGANTRDIFWSCLFENIVLCGIALLLDIFLLPLITSHVPVEIEMVWAPGVFLEMLILMFAVCLFLGWLSTRSILKFSPAKILKGE